MSFLKNLSIRNKLFITCLIPLLALFYYLQINISNELKLQDAAEQAIKDVNKVQGISAVLHELQKERALTIIYLSGNSTANDQLAQQREFTDREISKMEVVLAGQQDSLEGLFSVDDLPLYRAKVNALQNRITIDSFYYGLKAGLLDEIATTIRNSSSLILKNHFESHLLLLYTKEYLAQVRSELAGPVSIGEFTGMSYGNFASVKGKYEINLQKFGRAASPGLLAFFNRKFQGPFVSNTHANIDYAFANPSTKNFPFSHQAWWDNVSSCINALKEVEDHSSLDIREIANAEMANANTNLLRNLVIAVVVMVLISIIVYTTIRGIIDGIGLIKNAAGKMAVGDLNLDVRVKTSDEIGLLAATFNKMIAESRQFAESANAIGQGNYLHPVKVRSEGDVLGIAMETMKNNLQRLSKENEERTWLLKGNSELNDKLRGEKDVRTLSGDAITQLTTYLRAQVGAIYILENDVLELTGTYAFHQRKGNINSFRLGEGMVGQAAIEKKPIIFSDIPEGYITIQSGLGYAVPRNVIVYPFLYQNEVKGVFEIASVEPFTELQVQFLNMVGENLGIAYNAAQSRTRLQDLLEETQRQAEELEAQQEELKQSNEELHEKTELLERSEAELKAQQEELQQTNEELEEKANLLEEQKEKLEISKIDIENKARELEVTSKYKSEFLANMSHELRTPLNSILILSQLLAENKSKALGDKEIEFARNIYNSGADLLNLINEILDLSKVESGRMELDIEEVELKELEQGMKDMFEELAKTRSIKFTIINKTGDIQAIRTDKLRLEQIIRNLLSNAFKFTGKGGHVEMIIDKTRPGHGKENNRSDVLSITVSDNGIGIPRDKHAIIFEAFQQADGSTKRKFGGTGLGLSISRELATALGGHIELESIEGKGSSFTLYLPVEHHKDGVNTGEFMSGTPARVPVSLENKITRFPMAEGEIHDDRDNLIAKDKLILILEDDPEFSKMLLDFVRERKFKGIVAAQGNTGLSYARHYKPDAILLDMKLPVMDGAEVLRHLKNDPELRHVPVQIISGYDKRKEGLEMGAFDFIRKPVNKHDLENAFSRIEEFINKKLKKLLIVEDNQVQSKAIKELIGNGDVKSFTAFSGEEAFEMMNRDHFDCVIMDLGLPDMSGFDLLEKIKSNGSLNRIPVVVYTGKDLSREEHDRLMKFANTVVLKTADSQERLLDETMLFLHRVESKLPKEKQQIIRQLHKTSEVLLDKKVLLVDDDIRNIYSLTNALEEEGMTCLTAENGKVAVKTLKDNPGVDIILMDVMMPEMDGYDATREIRKINKFAKLPIIALTAKAMKGDREKCLEAGMSDYVSKPVNIEQLLSLMRVWLYK